MKVGTKNIESVRNGPKPSYHSQIFASGPRNMVPKANFLLRTMEHGPEGIFSSWDLVPRKRCESGYKEHRIGPKWTETHVPPTKKVMRKLNLV